MKKKNVAKKVGAVALCSVLATSALLPLGSAYASEFHQGDVVVEMNTKDIGEKVYVETLVRNTSDHTIDKVVVHRTSDTPTLQYDDKNIKKLTIGGEYTETCSDDSTKCQLVLTNIPSKDSHELSKIIYDKKELKKAPTFKYTVGTKEYTGGKFDDAQVSTIESLNGTPSVYTVATNIENSTKPADLQPKEEKKQQQEVEKKPSTQKEQPTQEVKKQETKAEEVVKHKEETKVVEEKQEKAEVKKATVTANSQKQSNSTNSSVTTKESTDKKDGALAKTNTEKKFNTMDIIIAIVGVCCAGLGIYSLVQRRKQKNDLE